MRQFTREVVRVLCTHGNSYVPELNYYEQTRSFIECACCMLNKYYTLLLYISFVNTRMELSERFNLNSHDGNLDETDIGLVNSSILCPGQSIQSMIFFHRSQRVQPNASGFRVARSINNFGKAD